MGNCCTVGSSVEWAGDDWGSLTSKHNEKSNCKVFEEEEEGYHDQGLMKQRLLGAVRASNYDDNGNKSNNNNDGKVVKIMISKKELKQLLEASSDFSSQKKRAEGHHASPEQVLARLMYARDHNHHHRHWRPVLQSIPEVN